MDEPEALADIGRPRSKGHQGAHSVTTAQATRVSLVGPSRSRRIRVCTAGRAAQQNYMRGFQYLADGHHVDDAGNLIACTYVDFRSPTERAPITTLRKASPKQRAIPSCGTLRISKPSCFRDRGRRTCRR